MIVVFLRLDAIELRPCFLWVALLVLVADDREEFQHIAGFYATGSGRKCERAFTMVVGTFLTTFGEENQTAVPPDQSKQRRVKATSVAGISSGSGAEMLGVCLPESKAPMGLMRWKSLEHSTGRNHLIIQRVLGVVLPTVAAIDARQTHPYWMPDIGSISFDG
jgi:hypothetical protein